MPRSRLLLVLALVGSLGCTEQGTPRAVPTEAPSASAPAFTRVQDAGTAAASDSGSPAAADAGPDAATAEPADADAGTADAAPAADAKAAPAGPLPEVEITAYGMHIGGGPNDAATKAPIRNAVLERRDAFRACFAMVEEPTKEGTFGVDVRIPRDGGRAEVSKPRPGLKGEGVAECVVQAFESVSFAKPPKGAPMVVSISLRFSPKKP